MGKVGNFGIVRLISASKQQVKLAKLGSFETFKLLIPCKIGKVYKQSKAEAMLPKEPL